MQICGVICEYNPFHNGHRRQLSQIRDILGPDVGIVCLMSGSYVQRGAPAIFDKSLRAQAAVREGADLVLELPIPAVLSSAEGFAFHGVQILSSFCDYLCFGVEENQDFMAIALCLLSPEFPSYLREQLDKGLSFPAARQLALARMGADSSVLAAPNMILAVEYCKAILKLGAKTKILPILRDGSYHDEVPNPHAPSASSLRRLYAQGQDIRPFIPPSAAEIFRGAALHATSFGEKAILARLRSMTEEEFSLLPYGSEGLWRKFMGAVRQAPTLEAIIAETKSKRYTRTRLDRLIMCAFLGITQEMLDAPVPYSRVLALSTRGRSILNTARETGLFPNAGQIIDHPYHRMESKADALYALFSQDPEERPDAHSCRRIFYLPD